MNNVILNSVITCPYCGFAKREEMPIDACQFLICRAVLAASAFVMDNGDLLLLAVAGVTIDGQRLEGVGVRPTIEVPFDPIYAAGRDPQLDRAVQVLSERIKG
jgi:hypothetical protein